MSSVRTQLGAVRDGLNVPGIGCAEVLGYRRGRQAREPWRGQGGRASPRLLQTRQGSGICHSQGAAMPPPQKTLMPQAGKLSTQAAAVAQPQSYSRG